MANDSGMSRWNKQTTPGSCNESNGFNAFRWDVADIPEQDWDDFAGGGKPASKAPPAPSEDERSRGYVRGRARGD